MIKDLTKLKAVLKQLDYVADVKENKNGQVDMTTVLSEVSLVEEWDSKEDSRYEKYFLK